MEVTAIEDPGLGNTSWLVDLGDGSALVVDPQRDPRPWLAAAQDRGLSLRWVAETHLHADFVSGAGELAREAGARVIAPADGGAAHADELVGHGAELDLGGPVLRVLATPGHTPEHVSYLLVEGEQPRALFSGGALIVGGVARPDLIAPERTEPLARAAWRSITGRLLELPDELPVHPTHGGGSFCSAGASGRRVTTVGRERTGNPLLQADDEDGFVDRLLGGLGSFPPYFLKLRAVNQAGPRLYGAATPALEPLSAERLRQHRDRGGQVVDVRPIEAFAAGHVPGSISIELRDQFPVWLGWLVADLDTPLAFVVGDDQDVDGLVRGCLKVGYENLAGLLEDGLRAWQQAGEPLATTRLVGRPLDGRRVVDVRQADEWHEGHIEGAVHLELGELVAAPERAPVGPLITHCMHGQRSMTAASLLERAGRDEVAVYRHGPEQWNKARRAEVGR